MIERDPIAVMADWYWFNKEPAYPRRSDAQHAKDVQLILANVKRHQKSDMDMPE